MIYNPSGNFNGFAIEFKTPKETGKLFTNQKQCLENLETNNWKILVINNYGKYIEEIVKYNQSIKTKCKFCQKTFLKKTSLEKHMEKSHSEKNKFYKILDKCIYHKKKKEKNFSDLLNTAL